MNRQFPKKAASAAIALLLILFSSPVSVLQAEEALSVRSIKVGPDQVRIELSSEGTYKSYVLANPPRLVVDLPGASYSLGQKVFAGEGQYLKELRAGLFSPKPPLSRIVVDLTKMVSYQIKAKGNQILVALGEASSMPSASAAAMPGYQDPDPAPSPAVAAATPAVKPSAEVKDPPAVKDPPPVPEEMATQMSPEMAEAAKTEETAGKPDLPAPQADSQSSAPRVADIMNSLPHDRISVDFRNTNIRDVIRLLAAKTKFNIIVGTDVGGTLTLRLKEVPFDEAFRTVLSLTNLTTMQVGNNILRVLTPQALASSRQAAATATQVIPLNYSKASDLIATINQVTAAEGRKGTAMVDARTNSVIVTDSIEGLANTQRLVSHLDVRPKEVLIEVKIVEVDLNNSFNYGIQWNDSQNSPSKMFGVSGTNLVGNLTSPKAGGSPTTPPLNSNAFIAPAVGPGAAGAITGGGSGVQLPSAVSFGAFTFGRLTSTYFLSASLAAAAAEGKARVLSDPKIATLNNQAASINVTTNLPYVTASQSAVSTVQSVTYVQTGIQLTVTPTINADGRVTLNLAPVVSQASPTGANAATGAPAVNSRNAATTVLVKDGETIVIGGLISDSVSHQINKVPLLGDIPILGWLFKSKSDNRTRNELLIFVTPIIMQD